MNAHITASVSLSSLRERAGARETAHWALIVAVALMMFAAAAWSASARAAAPALRYAKRIEFDAVKTEELVACQLDGPVFAATRDGLPDLRLLDADAAQIPYILRQAATTERVKTRQTWTADNPKVELKDGGGLEVTLTLDKDDPAPTGLRLVTPLVDFQRRIRVEASTDGENWQPVVEDGMLFDYSQIIDVRNDSLTLPADKLAGNPRHFRITVDDLTLEQQSQLTELTRRLTGDRETARSERTTIRRQPFRIDRIEFWRETTEERAAGPRLVDYAVEAAKVKQTADAPQTVIPIKSHREPITRFTLTTDSRNFSRQARIEASRPSAERSDAEWNSIGAESVSRLDFRTLKRENLAISVPETRATTYQLVIDNRDSGPLSNVNVSAAGPAYEVIFLAEPNKTYRLAYGSVELAAPEYDTAALAASLADYKPIAATLGDEEKLNNVPLAAEDGALQRLLNNPALLTAAIALLAILLAVGLYRASRRIDELPR